MTDPEVFFTGFPGFLGSALIERILARGDGPVACLVQPKYRDLAQRRAENIEDRTETADAIQLYEGDITEPDLGLDDAEFGEIRELYHLAAVYDLGVEPGLAEAVNVRGTEYVLDFAEDREIDRLHYVSTCYVSGRYDGVFTEDDLQVGQTFNNHYEETKYRAEVAVQERLGGGLSGTIYRPAIVVGDSETGETDKYDGPYNLIQSLLAQSPRLATTFSFPGSRDAELNVVPRDFVVDAIAYLSARDSSEREREVYQLCDPAPLSVPEFTDTIAEAVGCRTLSVPATRRLARAAATNLDSPALEFDPETLAYLDHPTRYACPKTARALAGSGIEVPPFETYVGRLVEFVRQNPDVGDEPMV